MLLHNARTISIEFFMFSSFFLLLKRSSIKALHYHFKTFLRGINVIKQNKKDSQAYDPIPSHNMHSASTAADIDFYLLAQKG